MAIITIIPECIFRKRPYLDEIDRRWIYARDLMEILDSAATATEDAEYILIEEPPANALHQ
jgi:hypothetical protein